MEEVLSVYEQPYDEQHPKVCLDESPKQLISESRKGFIDRRGAHYVDYEYRREGVADLYMVVEPLAGYRKVWVEENRDFYGLCKSWCIVFFIFSIISDAGEYAVNDLVAYGV